MPVANRPISDLNFTVVRSNVAIVSVSVRVGVSAPAGRWAGFVARDSGSTDRNMYFGGMISVGRSQLPCRDLTQQRPNLDGAQEQHDVGNAENESRHRGMSEGVDHRLDAGCCRAAAE